MNISIDFHGVKLYNIGEKTEFLTYLFFQPGGDYVVYIVSDERIATENFEQGKIYKVDFVDETVLYGVCVGIGSDFVMLSGDISGYIFPLTMQTASQVSSIDLYTPIEPEPPISNLLQYQTGVPPFEFPTIDNKLFSWIVKGNMQQTGTPTPAAPIYPTEFNLSAINCNNHTTSISCEPLRKIGDYTDYKSESVEYRVIKKYEFTGQETDLRIAAAITATNAIQLPTTQSDYKREPFICSHMPVTNSSSSPSTHGFYGQFLTICFAKSMELDTLEKMRTYLQQQYAAGSPLTVWYVLSTPTTTAAATPDITTDAGENELTVTADLQPSDMQIVYKIADR